MPTTQQLLTAQQQIDANVANAAVGGGLPAVGANGILAVTSRIGDKNRTVFTFNAVHIALADNAGVVAFGSKKFTDMPEGVLRFDAIVADLAVTKSSAGVVATFNGDFGVGTVAANNTNALATTEQNVLPTTSTPAAVAGVTTAKGHSEVVVTLDGSTTALDLFLNVLVDDADHDVTGTPCDLIFTGTVTVLWENLGG